VHNHLVVKATDPRQARYAQNEVFFREVNERIDRLGSQEPRPITEYTCECANVDCTAHFVVSSEEYAAVRRHRRRFMVAPGHLDLEVEEIVGEGPRFWIVEKKGLAGEIAAGRDPRS
jgi:hypothetical protein